jgi:hypothetical protein
MKRVLAVLIILGTRGLSADEIYLKGGGKVSGVLLTRTATSIAIETAPGTVTVPMSRVERIVEGQSSLGEFRARAARLAPHDAAGWLGLADWARDRGLTSQAQEAYQRVLRLDPDNPDAHRALGHVPIGDRWGTQDESYRSQGLVSFEGRWITPEERRLILEERAHEAAERRAAAESAARAKESEARARLADAEAKRAEAERAAAESQASGTSWGTTWPIWTVPGTGHGQRPRPGPTPRPMPLPCARPQDCPAPPPAAQPNPAPRPQPKPRSSTTEPKQGGTHAGLPVPPP